MKILYITLEDLFRHKGSVTHVKEVVNGLRKQGHEVGLIGRPWNSIWFSFLFLLISLFRKLPRYDIIYGRDYHAVIIALWSRLLYSKKIIYEINGIASEEQKLKSRSLFNRLIVFLVKIAEKIAAKNSDKIISVTPQIAHYLHQDFDCPLEKIAVVGNGVDTERFRPINDRNLLAPWRERWGVDRDDSVILFVGNLARWQGVETLIESGFNLFQKNERIKILIVGDGPCKKYLMKNTSESRWKQKILFTGMVDYEEIPLLINIGDICVAPFVSNRNQKTGVSPLKIFEYMACGKPVVASRISGLEFIEEEGIGRLFKPGNKEDLEYVLTELINNRDQRERMGQNALILARQRFDWKVKVIEIERILKELLA